jgi:(1->4)-alpha-D-glucan 1-alpha-D-glucosylmutase
VATRLWLTRRLLAIRASHEALLRDGDYSPLEASGERAGKVFAFGRCGSGRTLLAVVPRLTFGMVDQSGALLPGAWGDTMVHLPGEGPWRNLLTGETHSSGECSTLLTRFPVAVIEPLGSR